MSFHKILVAFDGSELSKRALNAAIHFASGDTSIEIEVLVVITVPNSPYIMSETFQELEDSFQKAGNEVISKLESVLKDVPNRTRTFLKEGPPARVILEHANENRNDMIIIGSRGLGGLKEFLGSVSHYVVQQSHVPVLVIK